MIQSKTKSITKPITKQRTPPVLSKKLVFLLATSLAITTVFVAAFLQPNELDVSEKSITQKTTDKELQDAQTSQTPTLAKQVVTKAVIPSNNDEVEKLDNVNAPTIQTQPQTYLERVASLEDRNSFHEKFLEDHEEQNRYPEFNQRIPSADLDPIERRYEIDERTAESEDGKVTMSMWSNKKYYLHGDEVIIYATLQDKIGLRVPTTFVGMLIYNESKNLSEFEFQDWDQDGIYEHRFTITQGQQAMPAGVYKVLIVNKANDMVNAVTFILSAPEIELTGNYQDTIDNQGNLIIGAEVEVTTKNRFYFQAALYSQSNKPIGATQYSTELKPGKHWIPLTFDGLLISDAGHPGPYLLKNISLTKVVLPAQRAPLIYPKFYTQDYKIEAFRSFRDNTIASM